MLYCRHCEGQYGRNTGFCNQKIKSSPECPQNQRSSQLHFLGFLQKMGRNEDSCTRRANDLEANYTFLKVCS